MSTIAGSCFGSCCATCACEGISRAMPKNNKILYLIIMFLTTILSLILRYWGGDITRGITIEDLNLCTKNTCYGYEAVYRISFACFLFFITMALFLTIKNTRHFDRNHFGLKILYYILLIVIVWFIPDKFYDYYVYTSRFFSSIFLIFQIMILIIAAYDLNDNWINSNMKKVILITSGILYSLSLTACILLYKYFTSDTYDCSRNTTFITITVIMTFICTIVAISEKIEHGALLPSAVVTIYCYWENFSALQSDPNENCNALINKESDNNIYLIIGLIWAGVSVTYAAWNLATNNALFFSNTISNDSTNKDDILDIPIEASNSKFQSLDDNDDNKHDNNLPPEDPKELNETQQENDEHDIVKIPQMSDIEAKEVYNFI